MDLNEHELAELEERLYSNIHHAEADSTNSTPASNTLPTTLNSGIPLAPSRIVTEKSIINNARQTATSKIKRYWDSLQQHNKITYPGLGKPKKVGFSDGKPEERIDGEPVPSKKVFTPYQPILGSMNSNSLNEVNNVAIELTDEGQYADRLEKKNKTHGESKTSNHPNETRKRKMEQLKKLKGKKAKALRNRKKLGCSEQRLIATIDLDSSSEEEEEFHSPNNIKQEKNTNTVKTHELGDSDPDEVVLIPTAPPPLVCIVDSEDELVKDKFMHPKSRNKKQTKKINSPRCISPSNSSIMSDDFIGQHDRSRLNDSFLEGITNDEELDLAAPHTVGSLLAGERRGFEDLTRQTRAPSISSDCTMATSSDTTDQEKRNGIQQNSLAHISKNSMKGPKVCSTPKQTSTVQKSNVAKTSKTSEEDSIYSATSAKKARICTDKVPSSDSSDASEEGNVSSHSKRSKSYQSDTGSTKSMVKRRKKRRKQDSDHFSEEDFASMLTDIVQANSENEESSDQETIVDAAEILANEIVEEQLSISLEECEEHTNELHKEEVVEPQNQVSLPQIKHPIETSTVVEILEESNDSSSVVNLIDESIANLPQKQNRNEGSTGLCSVADDDPECCWNDEIRKFYKDSWNGEDFNISTVLFNMPRSSKYWSIVHKDKYPDPPKKDIVCNNCGERGHMRYKCRNPPKPKICYMCGLAGHQEVRCPNTLCLKCGEKTKSFLRGCQSCAREQNMTCHLCGVRGHAQRYCPDKWRRYHSTIEDNKLLTQQYVRNPNAKHCCICSRAGHQAHMCNAALKIFGQLVPTTEVKSYQHVYQLQRSQQQNRGQKFNQFSDMTDYRLNFDESFAANENSFYYRFAKSVGIIEEKKREDAKLARKLKRVAKKPINVKVDQNQTIIIHDDSEQKNVQQNCSNSVTPQGKAVNEDSNYSFSEFYEDRNANLPQTSDKLPDYIPLVSSELTVTPVNIEQLRTDAKIFLTKPHAKILLGPLGATFLKDASSKFSLNVSISFQSVGNVLMANGLSADQDNFHNELVKFLNDASHQNEQLKLINNVPKATDKTIRYITDHLLLLTRSYENAKILFKRYQHFEGQGANTKTCDKIRRTLNIILFGQYGLRGGREHLTKLQLNLKNLQTTRDENLSVDFRDEINQHIRYIFTSFDHSNYEDILNEYENLRKNNKLQKVKPEDLNLPTHTLAKESNASTNYAEDSFNEFKDLNFAENEAAVNFLSSLNQDLILNTSDQLIDPSRNSANYHEHYDLGPMDLPPLRSTIPPKKKEFRNQSGKTMMEECNRMIQILNEPISAKFEQLCIKSRNGKWSKSNYRALKIIHSIMRGKLSRLVKKKG